MRPEWMALGTNAMPLAIRGMDKWGQGEVVLRNVSIIFQSTVDPKAYVELATNKGNPYIRSFALSGLTFNADPAITSLMVDALSDTNAEVQLAALGGLGLSARRFVPGELPAIVSCLQSPDPNVRCEAAILFCIQQQNGPQPALAFNDMAKAAFEEIKKAATNSDPYISQAAVKAMKEYNPENALTTYAHELEISKSELTGKQWTVTLKAFDENSSPISGADASIGYYIPDIQVGGSIGSNYQEIKGITDSNGVFVATHKGSFPSGYQAGKTGYYSSRGSCEEIELDDNDPAKWHQAMTLVLKKKINPVPMYVNRVDIAHHKPPTFDMPIGFDLTVGDWVAPYGKGKKPYMFFTWHVDYDTNDISAIYGKRRSHGSEETMTISFPNPGDGIQEFDSPQYVNKGVSEGNGWSELLSPPLAPMNGYQSELVKLSRWNYHKLPNEYGYDHVRNNYFFRVSTVTDGGGRIISAEYGKIYGDFDEALITYLNPDPHSRELEYNMRNLGPGGNNSYFVH
jgi:hypothetical protein